MISCADFMAEVGEYLDGDAAVEVLAQLREHIAHCQTCSVLVDSSRKMLKVVTDAGSFDLPQAAYRPLAQEIMARIKETHK